MLVMKIFTTKRIEFCHQFSPKTWLIFLLSLTRLLKEVVVNTFSYDLTTKITSREVVMFGFQVQIIKILCETLTKIQQIVLINHLQKFTPMRIDLKYLFFKEIHNERSILAKLSTNDVVFLLQLLE